ncbi:TRAP transporter substrate-binding protein DctP [Viridibacterium curvum]|uniref:TRAP transporter substrate-binding protein n=1 Tax=Viridibacterium curvum TaxID=1101404 RepID=A0ABP9QDB8_9RHOO
MSVRNAFACGLALCLLSVAPAVRAVSLVSADVQKPDHPVVKAQEYLAKLVTERSKGALTMQVKPNGEVGNETEVLAKLRSGELAMARVAVGVLADKVPAAKILSLPYLFRSRDHLWKVLGGDLGSRLDSEITASGVVVLAYYDSGSRSFYARKPIKTRADFAGLKVRVQPSPVYKDLISELGGTPVVLPYDKVADALKSGEVDGAENNIVSYVSAEHYKYAKYLSLDEHGMVPDVLLISRKAWIALGPANQELLRGAAAESSQYMAKLWQEKERDALALAKKNGVTVLGRNQLAMSGIESSAVKLYNRYVEFGPDMDAVLQIVSGK